MSLAGGPLSDGYWAKDVEHSIRSPRPVERTVNRTGEEVKPLNAPFTLNSSFLRVESWRPFES